MSKRRTKRWLSFLLITTFSVAYISSFYWIEKGFPSSLERGRSFEKAKVALSPLEATESLLASASDYLLGNSLRGLTSPGDSSASLASLVDYDYQQQLRTYQIQEGDTLTSLSEEFGVSLETLSWANDLSPSSVLAPGHILNILPVSGVLYSVQSGDTLSQIAVAHKTEADKILTFNNLEKADSLLVGDLLIIPDGEKPAEAPALTPVASSYFILPTSGYISQGLHPYNAIDVANNCGTPIYAAAGGVIQRAGWISIGGNRVRILHSNGVVTYYGHLSKILVTPGQTVVQGQEIGLMGETGHATGCHLHFDVRGATNPLASYPVGSVLQY
jgi:murein DD-endopeptidase MepM/ murein hydrolase activator NlpD